MIFGLIAWLWRLVHGFNRICIRRASLAAIFWRWRQSICTIFSLVYTIELVLSAKLLCISQKGIAT